MFNQLITFLVVILLFELYVLFPQSDRPEWSMILVEIAVAVVLYYAFVRLGFARWERRMRSANAEAQAMPFLHASLLQRYAVLAVLVYACLLYLLHWRSFCEMLLGGDSPQALLRLMGILPFMVLLVAAWAAAYPSRRGLLKPGASLPDYLTSQARLHLAILLPWLGILLLMDLLSLLSPHLVRRIEEDPLVSLVIFVGFLVLMAWIFPGLVVRLWRCPPLPEGSIRERLENFFADHGFRYTGMVLWTLFEGSISTAGILGLFPRSRYILITPSLLRILNDDELEAVMAHEMGHARHRHMLFYLVFLLGLFLVFGICMEAFNRLFAFHPLLLKALGLSADGGAGQNELASTFVALLFIFLCILIVFVYFRYGFGVFSRNFERQSDLHALAIQETSEAIVGSFEKISGHSAFVRMLPSWHHFSIQDRIDFLMACEKRPALIRQHHRKVRLLVAGYLAGLLVFAGILLGWHNFGWGEQWSLSMLQRVAEERLGDAPEDPSLWFALGSVAFERGDLEKGESALQRSVELNPESSEALNNLAWLYATATDEAFRRPKAALRLAQRAVELSPSAHILDTLAEAYFINHRVREAIEVERRALAVADDREDYYRNQLSRFHKALSTASERVRSSPNP